MRTAIIVFTKVPKAGDIKTRLTEEKGGILTPEEAKDLYEACLLDVIDHCIEADCGEVYICCNKSGDREYLGRLLSGLEKPGAIKNIYADQGGSFDQCMQYAADTILKGGLAESVLVVGGDLPGLQPSIIREGVRKLNFLAESKSGRASRLPEDASGVGAAIVVGVCQEGGFSIIGYTCGTPFGFAGVFYNPDGVTALDMLTRKAREKKVPLGLLEMLPDLDIPLDLATHIPVVYAMKLAAETDPSVSPPKRTIRIMEEMGLESTAAPPQR